jgi:hypothetical protein
MRNRIAILLTGFLLISTFAWAMEGALLYFQAAIQGSSVKIDWEMANESGIDNYDLYRKSNAEPNYKKLTSVSPNGSRRYSFTDTDVNIDYSVSGPITYRLTLNTAGTDVSHYTTLSQAPSSVQRSWGSIKSMFR